MAMRNALTIDLEDWFHILDVGDAYPMSEWGRLESRVERNTDHLLAMLEAAGVHATFFVLGWVADHHPQVVRRVAAAGHEVASHGYGHELAYEIGRDAFCEDARRSIGALEEVTGEKVIGYRTAGFSLVPGCEWAFDCLVDLGIRYDSSLFPAARGHGGWPGTKRVPHDIVLRNGDTLREFPISVLQAGPLAVAFCGGGYFRLFPYPFIHWGIRRLNGRGEPAMVYLHPREIDPGQPRMTLPPGRRFKSYVNLAGTEKKFEHLLRDFAWAPAAQVLGLIPAPA
jgi:polysaccharide deacetylase family protein (PEP-CTERM system associated)